MSRFDTGAKDWDKKERRTKLARDVACSMEKRVRLDKDSVLLDFGCGTGLIMLHFADKAGKLVGFDYSEGMVEVLRDKAAEAGLHNVEARRFDLDADEFDLSAYDVIVSSMVMHHLKAPEEFLTKAYEALKDGGQIMIADLSEEDGSFHENQPEDVHHHGFSDAKFTSMLENAGFKNVKVEVAAYVEKEQDGSLRKFPISLAYADK